jgi:hypothetical protein
MCRNPLGSGGKRVIVAILALFAIKNIWKSISIFTSGQGTYSGNLRFPEPLPFEVINWGCFLLEGRGSGNRRFPEIKLIK